MTKFRNWLARKIGNFAIEHIAAPEYSKNLKFAVWLGTDTWRRVAEEESYKHENRD